MDQKTFIRHKSPKPCLFCPNGTQYCSADIFENIGFYVYICSKCFIRYIYFHDDRLANYTIYVNYGGKIFGWGYSPEIKKGYLKYAGAHEGSDLVAIPLFADETLVTFQKPPIITPENILEKIRVYLPFL